MLEGAIPIVRAIERTPAVPPGPHGHPVPVLADCQTDSKGTGCTFPYAAPFGPHGHPVYANASRRDSPQGNRIPSLPGVSFPPHSRILSLPEMSLLHRAESGLSTTCSFLHRPVSCLSTQKCHHNWAVCLLQMNYLKPDNRNNSYLYPRTRNPTAMS